MKYTYVLISILLTSILGWPSATVTGNVSTLGGSVPSNVVVRFTLQNCGSLPRIIGSNLVVSKVQEIHPTADGSIIGSIWRNDEITCISRNDSFYTVSIVLFQGGAMQSVKTMNIKVVTPTLDLNSAPALNSLAPAPFSPINVITNPPASQNIAQQSGTQTLYSGDGYPLGVQASTNVEHGFEISDSTGTKLWHFSQQPTGAGYPSYSFLLRSVDTTTGTTEDFLNCIHDGAAVGVGSCKLMAGLINTDVGTTVDLSNAVAFMPPAVAVDPPSCVPKKQIWLNTTGAGGQKLKVCNAAGTGGDVIGDGSGTSAVTTFNSRIGDILPVAGDYSALTETLTNKTIDSLTNTIITRSKIWFDFSGNNVSTASVACDTPPTGGATPTSFVGTTNTQISSGVLSFVDAATSVVTCKYRLPSDYAGASASVDIRLVWYQDTSVGNPSQNVRWQSAVTCIGAGQSMDKAWNTATASTSATAAQYLHVLLVFTALDSTACDAGDMLIFKVERLGADGADTFTNTARAVGAELTLVRNQ